MIIIGAILFLLALNFSLSVSNPCEGIDLGFVNDYTSCSHYFSCLDGRAFPKMCRNGRYFHDNACHLPGTVPCETCPSKGVISVGVPESCTHYTLCINGNDIDRECAPGTRFDRSAGRCNLEELVPCDYATCPLQGRGLKPDSTNCRNFIVCFDGVEVDSGECHGDLLFDSELRSCALADGVDCGDRPLIARHVPHAPNINGPSRFSDFNDVPAVQK